MASPKFNNSTASPSPRVLYITASSRIGGAEASLLRLIEGLQARGRVEVAGLICLEEPGPLAERAKALGLRVECRPVGQAAALMPGTFRMMRDLIGSFQPNIVQTYGLRADVAARRAAKSLPHPAPRLISSIRSPDPQRGWIHTMLDRATARYVDHFISNSQIGKWSRVVREGFAPERISVIYNGIAPPPEFTDAMRAEARARFGLGDAAGPIIAVIANLRPMKGHGAVIAAAKELKKKFPGIRFVCAGRDDSGGAIPAEAKAAGVSSGKVGSSGSDDVVLFPGFIEEPWPLLSISDYFLLPSSWEGCPTSILEAQAAGVPVIANNAGGIPELVKHGESGWLLHADAPRPDLEILNRTPPPTAAEVRRAAPDWKSLLAPHNVSPEEVESAITMLQGDTSLSHRFAQTAQSNTIHIFSLHIITMNHEQYYRHVINYCT